MDLEVYMASEPRRLIKMSLPPLERQVSSVTWLETPDLETV
jgi:hypothetical protein